MSKEFKKVSQLVPPPAAKPVIGPPSASVRPNFKPPPGSARPDIKPPPGPEVEGTGTGTRVVEKPSAGAGVSSSSFPAVKKMQQAILNFASVAASTDVTSMTGNKDGKITGEQDRSVNMAPQGTPNLDFDVSKPEGPDNQPFTTEKEGVDIKGKEHLGGSDPFGDFIVQQFVANDPAGKQYLNIDVAGTPERESASIEKANLRGLIDTISRVGSPGVGGGEKSVDGIWKNRTDNALKGISVLTKGMLDFASALKVETQYQAKNLEQFNSALPKPDYTALEGTSDIIKRSDWLASHITNLITPFFQELKAKILNNKEHRQYIDQKKPFVSYKQQPKKSVKEILTPQELAGFTNNQMLGIPQVGFSGVSQNANWISLKELSDLDSFKGFMKRIGKGKEAENPAEVKKMLDAVSTQLSSKAG